MVVLKMLCYNIEAFMTLHCCGQCAFLMYLSQNTFRVNIISKAAQTMQLVWVGD